MGPAIGFTIGAAYNAEPGVAVASGEDVADVAFCPAVAKAETGTFHFVVNALTASVEVEDKPQPALTDVTSPVSSQLGDALQGSAATPRTMAAISASSGDSYSLARPLAAVPFVADIVGASPYAASYSAGDSGSESRSAALATAASYGVAVADIESMAVQDESSTPWGPEVVLGTEGRVQVTKNTADVATTSKVTVEPGSNYTVVIDGEDLNGDTEHGYGVLGNGSTVITVDGTREDGSVPEISDTSLKIESFLHVSQLNIDGNAVVTLSPGMFMNGDMDHDLAGKEGREKSAGVRIGEINLGYGSLILNNGDGFLFDNGYWDPAKTDTDQVGDAVSGNEGYTLNVTHDKAYVQIGSNMRTKWALINGLVNGEYHSLTVGGQAREFNITKITGIKDLTLQGGQFNMAGTGTQFNIKNVEYSVHGNFTIGHAASVFVEGNNIMAEGSGKIDVAGSLDIKNSTQTLTGSNSIHMDGGYIGGVNTSDITTDGLQLKATTDGDNTVELTYTGMTNRISADINVESQVLFSTMSTTPGNEVRDKLSLSGYLSGGGDVTMSGSGMVVISAANEAFTGSVTVGEGSSLSLENVHALSQASGVTISKDSHLYLNTDGLFPVELQKLHLGDGAALAVESLPASLTVNANQAALSAEEITFASAGSIDIMFNDVLRTMQVYNVFAADNAVAIDGQSDINFYMNNALGDRVKFDNTHYIAGSSFVDGKHVYYVETRFGNIWNGADQGNGTWTSESAVWNNGQKYDDSEYDYALFFNQEGIKEATVTLGETVSAKGIYIQNVGTDKQASTKYTFEGGVEGVDIAGGTELHMRDTALSDGAGKLGNGSVVELRNVQAGDGANPMGWITVSTGELKLTEGTKVYFDGDTMVQVGAVGDALLSVDSSSELISSTGATLSGYDGGTASVAGVKITNNAILGGNSAAGTGISSLTNAAVNGFNVEAIELKGSGSIINGGIGADTGLSTDSNGLTSVAQGAEYTLGGNLSFSQTLVNRGTVTIQEGTVFEFGNLAADGSTYTFIDGGTIVGWRDLGDTNFIYNGVKVSDINGASFSNTEAGKISVTLSGISATQWDKNWGATNAPAFGKNFTGSSYADAKHFSASGEYGYRDIVADGPERYTVAVIKGGGSTSQHLFLGGGVSWGEYHGSQHYWLMDEGSDYDFKVAGMMATDGSGNLTDAPNGSEITGDTHLQINGAGNRTNVEVYGGSWKMVQTGNAYLSINAGGYANIYGASRDVDLVGSVIMSLNDGTLNTYYAGKVFTPEQITQYANGEFKFDSESQVISTLGNTQYQLPFDSVSHSGGIYATGVNWGTGGGGAATRVLGDADIYLGSKFDFSSNFAVIDGGGDNVEGTSTLHLTDGVYYANLNQDVLYTWIKAADERYMYLDQWSATNQQGQQPFMGKFTSIEIRGFDRLELADGAHIKIQASRFNMDQDITISGSGIVELIRPEVFQLNAYGIPLSPFCEKDSEQIRSVPFSNRAIILENGARLKLSTDSITAWNANSGWEALTQGKSEAEKIAISKNWSLYYDPNLQGDDTSSGYTGNNRSNITINAGTTMDITDRLKDNGGGSTLVDIFMAGHGTDGLGAIYKGVSDSDADTAYSFQFPYISLMDNSSIGIDAGSSPIYMYGADNVYDNKLGSDGVNYVESDYLGDYNQSTLKLNDHTLTITGGGTFAMVNTTVPDDVGGTIYVEEGVLRAVNTPDHRLQDWEKYGLSSENDARHVSIAKTTDIVLSNVGRLHTDLNNGSDHLSEPLGSGLQSYKFASLSGQGTTDLGDYGLNGIELIVNRDQYYTEYLDETQTYWNSNGYAYAVYSGAILGDLDSSVSKSGDGVQYFSGSESTYGSFMTAGRLGGTYVSGGILYAIGTSSFGKTEADSFTDGMTRVDVGVFGSGDMYWTSYKDAQGELHEGKVYLSDGVRITNPGSYYLNPQLPVDMHPEDKNMIIGVEAAPNGTALNATDAEGYIFLIDEADGAPTTNTNGKAEHTGYITLGGVDYVRIDTHNLSALNGVSGIYLDGTAYTAGDTIDRNKMLLISAADWEKVKSGEIAATVTGLGTAGYNEATWSGLLHDETIDGQQVSANLVKEGAGTLVLDQQTSYTGSTSLNGGTLRLKGWVDPNRITESGKFSMVGGSSLMLSFDGSYTDGGMDVEKYAQTGEIAMTGDVNEDTELSENLELVGRGDVRWNAEKGWVPSWENEAKEDFTDGETAALISDVGAGVDFTISGLLSGEGNLLHSGNGTLTLTGANTYSGGTVVTRSHVYVEHDTALGATASGDDSARVVTWKNSHLHFADGVDTTIAAPTANSIEGSVYIGEKEKDSPQDTQVTMTGNGYWAEQTYVENWNSTLLFDGAGASNTGGGDVLGNGAGVLSGHGTVAVSDAAQSGQLHDSFASMQDFNGSVVVEGAGSTLSITDDSQRYNYNVESGLTESTGHVTVSGQYAHFSAAAADIAVKAGSSMNLTSSGFTEYKEKGSDSPFDEHTAATVTANTIVIESGAELNVAYELETGIYGNLTEIEAITNLEPDKLMGYGLSDTHTQVAMDNAKGYDYHYDSNVALNQTAAGAADVTTLTVKGGSTYSPQMANTTLCGGELTLDVSEGLINLDITLDGEFDRYLKENGERQQIVLFSGVNSINYIGVGKPDTHAITLSDEDRVYYTMAKDYFDSWYINESTYLVWDASAGVVYLDHAVPEPASATLSLLALAALAARRRRK